MRLKLSTLPLPTQEWMLKRWSAIWLLTIFSGLVVAACLDFKSSFKVLDQCGLTLAALIGGIFGINKVGDAWQAIGTAKAANPQPDAPVAAIVQKAGGTVSVKGKA